MFLYKKYLTNQAYCAYLDITIWIKGLILGFGYGRIGDLDSVGDYERPNIEVPLPK